LQSTIHYILKIRTYLRTISIFRRPPNLLPPFIHAIFPPDKVLSKNETIATRWLSFQRSQRTKNHHNASRPSSIMFPISRIASPTILLFLLHYLAITSTSTHRFSSAASLGNLDALLSSRKNNAMPRFYATWDSSSLCSSKSTAAFESWEESYGSLEECCEVRFSWDFDNCMKVGS